MTYEIISTSDLESQDPYPLEGAIIRVHQNIDDNLFKGEIGWYFSIFSRLCESPIEIMLGASLMMTDLLLHMPNQTALIWYTQEKLASAAETLADVRAA